MKASRTSPVRLQLEVLEDRSVPTTATLTDGVLRVFGTEAAETIKLTQNATKIVVHGVRSVNAVGVQSIVIEAGGGNDIIETRTLRIGASIYAGDGDDFVVGTRAFDYLFGGTGNDRLFGMNGSDFLYGEAGNDRAFGMGGTDFLYGHDGDDFLDDGSRYFAEYADGGLGMDWNADLVAVDGTAYTDVQQLGAPTCGFLCTLSGLAHNGYDFTRYIGYAGFTAAGAPRYKVSFWDGDSWAKTAVTFDGTRTGDDPNPAAEGESWVILMQRAWIKFHGDNGSTWPHQAAAALTGSAGVVRHSVSDDDFSRFASALASNQLVTVGTVAAPHSLLIGDHAYTVMQTWGSDSNRWVQLRNPWGIDGGSTTDGDANDGLVWVRWSDFLSSVRYSNVV